MDTDLDGVARRDAGREVRQTLRLTCGHLMYAFDIAALLLAIAAVCGYINHRILKLPPTTGTLLVALAASLVVLLTESAVPAWPIMSTLTRFVGQIDFNETLMRGMLSFLPPALRGVDRRATSINHAAAGLVSRLFS